MSRAPCHFAHLAGIMKFRDGRSQSLPRMKYLIYGLYDPRTQELRYIGRSSSGLRRPREHQFYKTGPDSKLRCSRWAASLVKLGLEPIVKVFEELPDWVQGKESINEWLNDSEIFYISAAKELGANLTNLTLGGAGGLGAIFSEERRKKISESKKHLSEEYRRKISESNRNRITTDEARKNMRLAQLGRKHPEEVKQKIGDAHRGRLFKDEHRQKLKEANTGKRHSDEYKKNMSNIRKVLGRPFLTRAVKCLEDGNTFAKIVDASVYYNTSQGNICAVCRGRQKTTNGLTFRYIDKSEVK